MKTFLFAAAIAGSAVAAPALAATDFPTPQAYQAMLGKGFDVDWSKTGSGRQDYSARAVADFKTRGLSHVRIRIKDDASPALFAALDRQVKDCLAADIIPIIAYQADDFKTTPSPATAKKVVDWWTAVATHYRGASPLIGFDVMIEPSKTINKQPDTLNALYEQVVTAIRRTNPERIIFIAPVVRSSPEHLRDLEIPAQANGHLMAEWHFYASGPSPTGRKQWTTGLPQEKQAIQQLIDTATRWQQQTGVPTWVGAWMAGDYNKGNHYTPAQQAVFANYVAGALDAANIPFSVNSGKTFYDYGTHSWKPAMVPVLSAILHPVASMPSAGSPAKSVAPAATAPVAKDAKCYNKRGKLRRRCN